MSGTSPQHVVVLGGTGFLGSAIGRAFEARGVHVTLVARHAPHDDADLGRARLLLADVDEPGAIDDVLDGADHVVHAVGQTLPAESNADPVADATSSLTSILRTLEALKRRPEVTLSYLSSGGTVYGNPATIPIDEDARCTPISSYGVMKYAAEHYLSMYRALHGTVSVSLRVANAYGPGQPVRASQGFIASCLEALRRGLPVRLYGNGENVRDYVYIDDIARAVVELAALPAPPRVVNVASGRGASLNDVLKIAEAVSGRSAVVESLPSRGFDVSAVVLSCARLASLIAWDPLPLEDGIARSWAHLNASRPT